jgi:hypothetical protein
MIWLPDTCALLYLQPPRAGDAVPVAVLVAATTGLATTTGGGIMTTGTLICHAVGGPFFTAVDGGYEADVQITALALPVAR